MFLEIPVLDISIKLIVTYVKIFQMYQLKVWNQAMIVHRVLQSR